tara:strand:- start:175 stop:390 length:216 start_codon:yes stop_codon:yes gene_type:complete
VVAEEADSLGHLRDKLRAREWARAWEAGAGVCGVLEVVAEAAGVAKLARDLSEGKGEIGGVGYWVGRVEVG